MRPFPVARQPVVAWHQCRWFVKQPRRGAQLPCDTAGFPEAVARGASAALSVAIAGRAGAPVSPRSLLLRTSCTTVTTQDSPELARDRFRTRQQPRS